MPDPPQRRSRRSDGAIPAAEPEVFWLEGERGDANWTISTPVTANDIAAEHLPRVLPQYRKKALEAMRRLKREIPPEFEVPEWSNPVALKKVRNPRRINDTPVAPAPVSITAKAPRVPPAPVQPVGAKSSGNITGRGKTKAQPQKQPVQATPSASSDSDSDLPIVPTTSLRLTKAIRDANRQTAAARIAAERSIEAGRVATLAAAALEQEPARPASIASDSDDGAAVPPTTDQSSTHADSGSSSDESDKEEQRRRACATTARRATPASNDFVEDIYISDLEPTSVNRPSSAMDTNHSSDPGQVFSPVSPQAPSIRSPLGPARVYHRTPPSRQDVSSVGPTKLAEHPRKNSPERILVPSSSDEEDKNPRKNSPERILVPSSSDEEGKDGVERTQSNIKPEVRSPMRSASPTPSTTEPRRRYRRIDELQQQKPFLKAGAYHDMKYFPQVDDPHLSLRQGDLPHHPTVVHGSHGHLFPGMTMSSTDRKSVKKRSIAKNHLSEPPADIASEKSNTLLKREAASFRAVHQYAEYTNGFAVQILSRTAKFSPLQFWFSPAVLKAVDREKLLDWVWQWNEMVDPARLSTKQTNLQATRALRNNIEVVQGEAKRLAQKELDLEARERDLQEQIAQLAGLNEKPVAGSSARHASTVIPNNDANDKKEKRKRNKGKERAELQQTLEEWVAS